MSDYYYSVRDTNALTHIMRTHVPDLPITKTTMIAFVELVRCLHLIIYTDNSEKIIAAGRRWEELEKEYPAMAALKLFEMPDSDILFIANIQPQFRR